MPFKSQTGNGPFHQKKLTSKWSWHTKNVRIGSGSSSSTIPSLTSHIRRLSSSRGTRMKLPLYEVELWPQALHCFTMFAAGRFRWSAMVSVGLLIFQFKGDFESLFALLFTYDDSSVNCSDVCDSFDVLFDARHQALTVLAFFRVTLA